jgi:hypothetical protein
LAQSLLLAFADFGVPIEGRKNPDRNTEEQHERDEFTSILHFLFLFSCAATAKTNDAAPSEFGCSQAAFFGISEQE